MVKPIQTENAEDLEKDMSPSEKETYLKTMAQMEFKNLLHQSNQLLLGMMNHVASSNGVKQRDKGLSAAALINAVLFALDFGVDTSKVRLFEKGHKYYKENHTLAAMLAKAIETKVVLLAYKAKAEEEAKQKEADSQALSELDKELGSMNNEETLNELKGEEKNG